MFTTTRHEPDKGTTPPFTYVAPKQTAQFSAETGWTTSSQTPLSTDGQNKNSAHPLPVETPSSTQHRGTPGKTMTSPLHPTQAGKTKRHKIIKSKSHITKGSLKTMQLQSGVPRMGDAAREVMRQLDKKFLNTLIENTMAIVEMKQKSTIQAGDVQHALRNLNASNAQFYG